MTLVITSLRTAVGLNIPLSNGNEAIEIPEYDHNTITFTIPTDVNFRTGHVLAIEGYVKLNNETKPLEATVEVQSVTKTSEGQLIKAHLRQHDKKLWADILQLQEQAQDRVDKLLSAIKGE